MRIDDLLLSKEVFPFPNLLDEKITKLSEKEQKELLDRVLPKIVSFCYDHVPGIRLLMQSHDISPEEIYDLKSFLELFPRTNAQVIKSMGEELFLPQITMMQKTRHVSVESDLLIVEEELVNVPQGGESLRHFHTKADIRASAQVFFRILSKHSLEGKTFVSITKESLVNSIFEEVASYFGSTFLCIDGSESEIVKKILRFQDVVIVSGSKKMNFVDPISLLEGDVSKKILAIIHQDSLNNKNEAINCIHYGKLDGLLPTEIENIPQVLPNSLWVKDGGEIKSNGRGRIVLNKLLAVYEIDNEFTQCMRDLRRLHPAVHDGAWSTSSPYYGESIRRVQKILHNADSSLLLTKENFFEVYKVVRDLYFKHGFRVGISSGTQLLRYHTALYGEMEEGILKGVYAVNSPNTSKKLLTLTPKEKSVLEHFYHTESSNEREVFFSSVTPIIKKSQKKSLEGDPLSDILKNHIGGEVREASLLKEILDAKDEEPLYLQRIIDEEDLDETITFANIWSKEVSSQITLDDAEVILKEIYDRILKNKELQSVFRKKMGLLKSDVERLIEDSKQLTTKEHLQKTIKATLGSEEVLFSKKPISPFTIVTSGNINFYDGFLIFSHILLARIASKDGQFSVIVRPSSSDVVFSSIVYYFHEVVSEKFSKEKKLHTLLQKINWDPKLYPEFLPKLASSTKAGIYFGKGTTYEDVINGKRHKIYGEGLNAGIVSGEENLKENVKALLDKTFALKSKDCTSIGVVLVKDSLSSKFLEEAKKYAEELSKGGSGIYPKRNLQEIQKIIDSLKGEKFGKVSVNKKTMDLVLHYTDEVGEDVGKETPFPLLHIVQFSSEKEVEEKLKQILKNSNLSRFTSINFFGGSFSVSVPSKLVRKNSCEFSPYEPHDGGYFLLDFLE